MTKNTLSLALTLSLLGCQGADENSSTKITNGKTVTTSEFPSVRSMGCGATFITPDIMITAAHCVAKRTSDVTMDRVSTRQFILNPDYQPDVNSYDNSVFDMALIRFDRAVSQDLSNLCKAGIQVGNDVTLVGYGPETCFTTSASGHCQGTYGTKRVGYNRVEQLDGTIRFWGTSRVVDSSGQDASIAHGDSGSPLFTDQPGGLCVGGVLAHINYQGGTYTQGVGWQNIQRVGALYSDIHHPSNRRFIEANLPDASCDVYSTGCMELAVEAYQTIFGEAPNEERQIAMLAKLRTMRVSELRNGLSAEFFSWILPALTLAML